MKNLTLDLVGGEGEKPAPHDPVCLGPSSWRTTEWTSDELAEITEAPVQQLAALYYDMLEADDDFGCRSKRTRHLARIIRKRGISMEELRAALPPFEVVIAHG